LPVKPVRCITCSNRQYSLAYGTLAVEAVIVGIAFLAWWLFA
jgi:hypothetical protein